jgi:hypothetical protein
MSGHPRLACVVESTPRAILKPADFDEVAGKMIATAVRNERVNGTTFLSS